MASMRLYFETVLPEILHDPDLKVTLHADWHDRYDRIGDTNV